MSFSKLWEIVKDREAWRVRSRRESDPTEQLNNNKLVKWILETGRICYCTQSHLQSISDGAAVPGCSLSESGGWRPQGCSRWGREVESVPGLSPDLGDWLDISLAYPHISPRSLPMSMGALPVGVGMSVSLFGRTSVISG